ncbi:MAG: lycopene cyclase family protein, partial [Fulvivirga sp.]|nr:lycopene cyclase family protein [Fulvivirga sp.]
IRLLQHFKGWVIKTKTPVFDPNSFMMMDFRLKYPESTSFTYILPVSPNKALVEFTFFSPEMVKEDVYESYLKRYIHEILKTEDFEIVEEEQGVIPMSNFPFHKFNEQHLTKIGTAGSWVKPSSGYSFKNAEQYSKQLVENIKSGSSVNFDQPFSNRFRKYDALFLDVLWHHNHLGEKIFSDMYRKNKAEHILTFLDEKTSVWQDLKIMNSFQKWPFTKALLRSFKNF